MTQFGHTSQALASHLAVPGETRDQTLAREQGNRDIRAKLKETYENYAGLCELKFGAGLHGFDRNNQLTRCVQTEMNRDEELGRTLVDPITQEYVDLRFAAPKAASH